MKNNTPVIRPTPSIAVSYADAAQKKLSLLLAEKLNLPVAEEDKLYDLILCCTAVGLELLQTGDPSLRGAVRAEFVAGPSGYRRLRGGAEKLIRAIGHKKNSDTVVLDATGGLGRDAFVMAGHGCWVHVVERNPVAAALIEDGLQRAAENEATAEISARITLTTGDSIQFLNDETRKCRFDVIYLDPMFPRRSKSARVKKEMQILQLLVGPDEKFEELFATALRKTEKRVVVKRPISAPPLQDRQPSYSISGKSVRFDVYLAPPNKQVESARLRLS